MDKRPRDANRKIGLGIIAAAAFFCFILIAHMVASGYTAGFDAFIMERSYGLRGSLLNGVVIFMTCLGNWQLIAVVGTALLIFPGTRRDLGVPFVAASLSSVLLYKLMKSLFQRPRPDPSLHLIGQGGFSFPSGHAMNCMVCYGLLIYFIRRYAKNRETAGILTAALSVLIPLIGVSRIYVGVHFPTDILGGWSMGLAVLCICVMILEKHEDTAL